jgi:hypothetical protein
MRGGKALCGLKSGDITLSQTGVKQENQQESKNESTSYERKVH